MKLSLLLSFTLLLLTQMVWAKGNALGSIVRDSDGFPRCYVGNEAAYYFNWWDKPLTRTVKMMRIKNGDCSERTPSQKNVDNKRTAYWDKYIESKHPELPSELKAELRQIAQKSNELLLEDSPERFIEKTGIEKYTVELNRDLSRKYGQIFSAKVFKALIEKNERNRNFRAEVLKSFTKQDGRLSLLKERVSIVVSFGLGWEEKYSQATPIYVREFLEDIKSLGLDVRFLKKNPWGSVRSNAEMIKKQFLEELQKNRDVIIVSLCKGTPEILLAESMIHGETNGAFQNRILAHVNLSGMLDGTFYSDKSSDLLLPKLMNPFLKIIPLASAKETVSMYGAIDFMRSDVIQGVLAEAAPQLPKDLLYINITGAPLSSQVLENSSPMVPVVKYTQVGKLSEGANDGFLELPNTLIPESISDNQITLMLDSSHLLGDGMIDDYSLSNERIRRSLYSTIISRVLSEHSIPNE